MTMRRALSPVLVLTAMMLIPVGLTSPAEASPPTTTEDCIQGGSDSEGWTPTTCYENGVALADYTNAQTWSPGGLVTINNIDGYCSGSNLYNLIDQVYASGRAVPKGVAVDEPGGVGVTALIFKDPNVGYAGGLQSMSMTNWNVSTTSVTVTMHCTTDSSKWYQG